MILRHLDKLCRLRAVGIIERLWIVEVDVVGQGFRTIAIVGLHEHDGSTFRTIFQDVEDFPYLRQQTLVIDRLGEGRMGGILATIIQRAVWLRIPEWVSGAPIPPVRIVSRIGIGSAFRRISCDTWLVSCAGNQGGVPLTIPLAQLGTSVEMQVAVDDN